jgi:hypothetical protein
VAFSKNVCKNVQKLLFFEENHHHHHHHHHYFLCEFSEGLPGISRGLRISGIPREFSLSNSTPNPGLFSLRHGALLIGLRVDELMQLQEEVLVMERY